MSKNRIKDDQQFAHAGNQSDVWRFTRRTQPSVKVSDHGITPAGSQGSHVESSAYVSSTTPNDAPSPQQATIPIQWRHTYRRSNLFAVQAAKLRQLGQHSAANDGPDAGHTLEQIFLLTPDGTLVNRLVKVLIVPLQFRFEPMDVRLNAFVHSSRSSTQPVFFGGQHLGDLASATDQGTQFQGHLIRQGAQHRASRQRPGHAPQLFLRLR